MTILKPKFFDTDNKLLAHLEWEAIRIICFDGKHPAIADAYPTFEQKQSYWIDPFYRQATDAHHDVKRRIKNGSIGSIEAFYESVQPLLKPKARGSLLKEKKKRTSQAAYQKERYGDDFIENNSLISAAKAEAKNLCEMRADKLTIMNKVCELAVKHHNGIDLTENQIGLLCDLVQHQMNKLMHPDTVEAKLLDANDKNLWFMWGKIKRNYAVGDTFAWPTMKAAEEGKCSKSDVAEIMKKLTNAGAIKQLQKGKAGQSSRRASIYRREV